MCYVWMTGDTGSDEMVFSQPLSEEALVRSVGQVNSRGVAVSSIVRQNKCVLFE